MSNNILRAPRGMQDVLPSLSYKWRYIEKIYEKTAQKFGFREIRFPTLENTALFSRGVGDTTDIVEKEMYTFSDRGGRSLTLRPEGTACVVRALLQNGLHNGPMPQGFYYNVSCFRGERPQAGRLREFHQFGVELFGTENPAADAVVIEFASDFFKAIGVGGLRLEINSIGCSECRPKYQRELKNYFRARADELCEDCRSRLERNPMRILDCKKPACREVSKGAPRVIDFLCDECREHFEDVKERLGDLGIPFVVDPDIVRGLDYYTRTVFEFVSESDGLTACGGGRYDGLVSQLGGPSLPALGFAIGKERLLMVMEAQGCDFGTDTAGGIFLAPVGKKASRLCMKLAGRLRNEGLPAQADLTSRSVKAQMKYAGKCGFDFCIVVGESEIEAGRAVLKDMKGGRDVEISLNEEFERAVLNACEKN